MPRVPITEGRDTMEAAGLVGTWRMVGYHNRTEDGRELPQSYGPEFMGLFQFHPNGRVMLVECHAQAVQRIHGHMDVRRRDGEQSGR